MLWFPPSQPPGKLLYCSFLPSIYAIRSEHVNHLQSIWILHPCHPGQLFAMREEIFNENAQIPLKITTAIGKALILGLRSIYHLFLISLNSPRTTDKIKHCTMHGQGCHFIKQINWMHLEVSSHDFSRGDNLGRSQ